MNTELGAYFARPETGRFSPPRNASLSAAQGSPVAEAAWRRPLFRLICLAVAIPVFVGCSGGNSNPPTATPPREMSAPPPPPPAPPPSSVEKPLAPGATTAPTVTSPPAAPVADTTQKKAEVGVGAKGRGYGMGPIATPAAAFFGMREKIVFNIQIPKAVEAFKTIEGRAPATNEEYMQRIIKENQIPLPQLFEGERYIYDPKTETLMVERPAE